MKKKKKVENQGGGGGVASAVGKEPRTLLAHSYTDLQGGARL